MPSVQRGETFKRPGRSWEARWYDADGQRQTKGGFETKSEARDFVDRKVDEVLDLPAAGDRPKDVDALLDLFLEKHGRTVDPATKQKLTRQLRKARDEFGDRDPDGLRKIELEDWREQLPVGSRHDCFRAFRQSLAWAVAWGYVTRDASVGIRNPKRKRHERAEIHPFETWAEVVAIADELDPRDRAIPIVGVGTGLRPEELFGLRRDDVDRGARALYIRRRFTGGALKDGGKTDGSVLTVPLRQVVLDAMDAMPPRIDTPVLFPAPRGGHIDGERFREREWKPALRAAGIEHRGPKMMRHTFATWAIEDDVPLSHLATIMGTSVRELEDTYFRWLKRTDDQLRAAFDRYDAAAFGRLSGAESAENGYADERT